MPIYRTPESEHAKEMKKFEGPYVFKAYPRMMYKAQKHPLSGKWQVACDDIVSLDKTTLIVNREEFGRSCQMTVNSESEMERARDNGWRESPGEALAFQARLDLEMATVAAHMNYEDRNMSAKAQSESLDHQLATDGHVAEIPRRRGKGRPKAVAVTPEQTPAPVA